jgi:LysM repeat protein
MASRRSKRRSGRGRKQGGGGMMFLAGLALVAAGAGGGWYMFHDREVGEAATAISELVQRVDVSSVTQSSTPAAPQEQAAAPETPRRSLAQVDVLLTEVSARLSLPQGDAREAALREDYARLSTLLEAPLPMEERVRAIGLFHRITDELFLSATHNEFNQNHVVRSGDSYDQIARRYGIGLNLLYDLNNRPRGTRALHPNENLKVPLAAPRVVVRKRDYTTSVYFGDHMVRQYIVAHGRNNNTPEGGSTIATMTVDPEKTSRGPNDPVNEMKLRWIGMEEYAGGRTGIGFHGTQFPESIPGMTSRGCIRMHDRDVIELYDFVRFGNKVEVRP